MNRTLSDLRLVLGKRGIWFVFLGSMSSFSIPIVEFAFAGLFVTFLASLGMINAAGPGWFNLLRGFTPGRLFLAVLLTGIIRAVVVMLNHRMTHVIQEFVRARLRMIQGFEMLSANQAKSTPLSEVNLRMNEFFPAAADFAFHLSGIVSTLIQSLVLCVVLVFLARAEAVIGIIGILACTLIVLKISTRAKAASRKLIDVRRSIEESIVRVSKNWLLIRMLRFQEKERQTFLDSIVTSYQIVTKLATYRTLALVIPPLAGIFIIAALIYANFTYFQIPAAHFVAFVYLFVRFYQIAANGAASLMNAVSYRVPLHEAATLVRSLTPLELELATTREAQLGVWSNRSQLPFITATTADSSKQSVEAPRIELSNVSFRWPDSDQSLFSDLSISVPEGAQVGIVGPNGSGKSTMLALILGMLKPVSGKILIQGSDAEAYVQSNYHVVAYAGSQPYLVQGSIRENLVYGMNGVIGDGEMLDVLEVVELDRFVQSLPGKLSYVLTENADTLSTGQKQRLAIARALLRKPALLLLDEASSNLDESAEQRIAELLKRLKNSCTMVIAAHKRAILKNADVLLDLGTTRK